MYIAFDHPSLASSGAREMWENEFYKHPAPLALRTDNVDSDDLLFAQASIKYAGQTNITVLRRVCLRWSCTHIWCRDSGIS
jgi:hypothetical protein